MLGRAMATAAAAVSRPLLRVDGGREQAVVFRAIASGILSGAPRTGTNRRPGPPGGLARLAGLPLVSSKCGVSSTAFVFDDKPTKGVAGVDSSADSGTAHAERSPSEQRVTDDSNTKARLFLLDDPPNSMITASHAYSHFCLDPKDLVGLPHEEIRTAYSYQAGGPAPATAAEAATAPSAAAADGAVDPDSTMYFRHQVHARALEVWGSGRALDLERQRRLMENSAARAQQQQVHDSDPHNVWSMLGEGITLREARGIMRSRNKELTRGIIHKRTAGQDLRKLQSSARLAYMAIGSNVVVTGIKFGAWFWTGSQGLLSEALHSVADCVNQCLLAVGIRNSIRSPDPDHPYGFSRERYVWALISGVGVFFVGSMQGIVFGAQAVASPHTLSDLHIGFTVLAASAAIEAVPMHAAFLEVTKNAKAHGMSLKQYLLHGPDPIDVGVLAEDTAAVVGVGIAATGLGVAAYTGNPLYDAYGSIAVGSLLGLLAVFLIQRNKDALIGRSIPRERLELILKVLNDDPVVHSVHDVKCMTMSANNVRFKAEINFDGAAVTKKYLKRLDTTDGQLDALVDRAHSIKNQRALADFLLQHGDRVIDQLGMEVDRIEHNIKTAVPECKHVDLEIL